MVVTTVVYYASAKVKQTTKLKSAFWDIYDSTVTLAVSPQNLTPSSSPQSPFVVNVWSNSIKKYPRYRANYVCSGLKHARMHEHSGDRHNASDH